MLGHFQGTGAAWSREPSSPEGVREGFPDRDGRLSQYVFSSFPLLYPGLLPVPFFVECFPRFRVPPHLTFLVVLGFMTDSFLASISLLNKDNSCCHPYTPKNERVFQKIKSIWGLRVLDDSLKAFSS